MLATSCLSRHSPAQPGRPLAEGLAPLRARLQRLAAAASPAGGPSQPAAEQQSFVTEEERRLYVPEQLVFLERKRRAAAGLGPIFPEGSVCERCGGSGSATCHQCGGSGMNATEKAQELFQNERNLVVQNNGRVDTQFFFRKDCPCWLCRGQTVIGCPDCGGSGLTGLADFTAD